MMSSLAFLNFHEPLWVYIAIPFAAAFVGWFTKIVAVKMMFHPIEFKGIRPFFGWQGQIPKKAAKMAGIAVDSITAEILKPEEIFEMIDPDEMVSELAGPLHDATAQIVEEIMVEFHPTVWEAMPDVAKRQLVARVEARAPAAIRSMMDQVRGNLDQVFDIKHMVVSNLVRDKAVLNRMFQDLGRDAFAFMIRSGLYFGFYIGLVLVAVFGITGSHLVLPVFGFIIGGLTDYIALTMIFRPITPKPIGIPGVKWQGLFHKLREQVTEDYTTLLAKDILTPAAIMESLLTGPMSDRFFELLEEEIQRTVDAQTGIAKRFVVLAVGGRQWQEMKRSVAERVIAQMPEQTAHVEAYAEKALDIQRLMADKMSEMDDDAYENLLRPAFKDDEWVVVALGALLGGLFGELQVQLIIRLA